MFITLVLAFLMFKAFPVFAIVKSPLAAPNRSCVPDEPPVSEFASDNCISPFGTEPVTDKPVVVEYEDPFAPLIETGPPTVYVVPAVFAEIRSPLVSLYATRELVTGLVSVVA